MRATTAVSAFIYAFGYFPAVSALSSQSREERDPRLEGKSPVDTLAVIDLNSVNVTGLDIRSGDLIPRVDIRACAAGPAQAGVCIAGASAISAAVFSIASLFKSNSNSNDCSEHSGMVDDVHWRVYATGKNCDTTAQLDTIRGALSKYLKNAGDAICGTHCLRLDHGGTWNGYVTLAASVQDIDTFYCGPAYAFGSCVKGGKNDV